MKKALFSIFSILLLLTSCGKREWTNPFDPDCPKEIWTPKNFLAVQEGQTIKLTWNQPNPNIDGFKIKKTVGILNPFLKDEPKTSTQLIDSDPVGGQLQTYEIKAYAGNNLSNPATITITPLSLPTLSTSIATSITGTSMVIGGTISSDGGATITSRGICWATTAGPTTDNSKLAIGSGTGTFSSTITNLSPNTIYHFRAYAINSQGTAYGSEVTFTTLAVLATLTTTAITNIGTTSATSGGNITNNGGATITVSGICWGTSQIPTTSNSKTTNGTSSGAFTSNLTGLTTKTTYYVRAYATNSAGTGYATQVNFTTK